MRIRQDTRFNSGIGPWLLITTGVRPSEPRQSLFDISPVIRKSPLGSAEVLRAVHHTLTPQAPFTKPKIGGQINDAHVAIQKRARLIHGDFVGCRETQDHTQTAHRSNGRRNANFRNATATDTTTLPISRLLT